MGDGRQVHRFSYARQRARDGSGGYRLAGARPDPGTPPELAEELGSLLDLAAPVGRDSLAHTRLPRGGAMVCRAGADPGGVEVLYLPPGGRSMDHMWPIDLWRSPTWLDGEADGDGGPRPAVGVFDRESLTEFARERRDRLAPFLADVRRLFAHPAGRQLVIVERDPDTVARWVALACRSLGEPHARVLTFTTRTDRPDDAPQQLLGIGPEAALDREDPDALLPYRIHDGVGEASSPPREDTWAERAARCWLEGTSLPAFVPPAAAPDPAPRARQPRQTRQPSRQPRQQQPLPQQQERPLPSSGQRTPGAPPPQPPRSSSPPAHDGADTVTVAWPPEPAAPPRPRTAPPPTPAPSGARTRHPVGALADAAHQLRSGPHAARYAQHPAELYRALIGRLPARHPETAAELRQVREIVWSAWAPDLAGARAIVETCTPAVVTDAELRLAVLRRLSQDETVETYNDHRVELARGLLRHPDPYPDGYELDDTDRVVAELLVLGHDATGTTQRAGEAQVQLRALLDDDSKAKPRWVSEWATRRLLRME
ncbi:GAP1-M domain-containing protein [Streptomyces sp. 4N509B]|uniref:GAP1-M domain-containing protein n=1 Tax=Streptomyces sp. 4N509B TaxID=3457413 RepID=UPI003FD49DD7